MAEKKSAKEKPKKAEKVKAEKPLGKVTHYYDKIKVAVVDLAKGKGLKVGDSIRFEKADFSQEIASLQVEHEEVKAVKAGTSFGLKVKKAVREGDQVFKD